MSGEGRKRLRKAKDGRDGKDRDGRGEGSRIGKVGSTASKLAKLARDGGAGRSDGGAGSERVSGTKDRSEEQPSWEDADAAEDSEVCGTVLFSATNPLSGRWLSGFEP